jgi:DNA-binding GntR family transcriptional regulator
MIPKYIEVIQHIEKIIESAPISTMIPSERTLSDTLQISRMTVRKAIDILVSSGKLYRINHVGTFIKEQKLYQIFNTLMGFSDEVVAAGGKPSSKIISFNVISSDSLISQKLNIPKSSKVYQVKRLRKMDGKPMVIQESYYPCDLIHLNQDIIKNSIYNYIQKQLHLSMESLIQEIKAVLLSKDDAILLEMKEGSPTIYTESIGYLTNGRIFEFTKATKNQDNYELIVQAMNVRTLT